MRGFWSSGDLLTTKVVVNFLKWRFDVFERYQFYIKRLNKQTTPILEIGAGDYGLEYFGFKNTKATDIDRKREHLDITQPLPDDFPQFDVVVAVDVLEHIPPNKRTLAIKQMLKIAKKKVFLSVPNDQVAHEFDKKLNELFTKKSYHSKHLEEHIKYGIFDLKGLIKQLKELPQTEQLKTFNGIDIKTHEKIALFLFSKSKPMFLLKNKLLYPIRNLIISHNQSNSPYHKFIEITLK